MRNEPILRTATFNPRVKTYWLLGGYLILFFCVFTIPLMLVWYFVGGGLAERYLRSLSAQLTERNLHIKKGFLFRVEKTVPLEKITDLGQHQGPIMRYLNLQGLTVETAGQSAPGSLVRLIGIEDSEGFRDAVLDQRDALLGRSVDDSQSPAPATQPGAPAPNTLEEIRDSLLRIEEMLRQR
ncbi:MAG: PH domain-containing protein [Planctomycetes bacterium]|nr:PH domain-containing protein [Planctomycetota bacterium]